LPSGGEGFGGGFGGVFWEILMGIRCRPRPQQSAQKVLITIENDGSPPFPKKEDSHNCYAAKELHVGQPTDSAINHQGEGWDVAVCIFLVGRGTRARTRCGFLNLWLPSSVSLVIFVCTSICMSTYLSVNVSRCLLFWGP